MAKRVKDRWLSARVDEKFDEQVSAYTEATEMDKGELVRMAVKEYMDHHPPKVPGLPTADEFIGLLTATHKSQE